MSINQFIIITGGPGVGKTSLLNAVQQPAISIVPEVARDIIREQIEINGDTLPWRNTVQYTNLMLSRSIESYQNTLNIAQQESGKLFLFDRGIPDTICYATMTKHPDLEKMKTTARNYPYNKKIFLLPPWKAIYETDSERKQNWQEVMDTHIAMIQTYEELGYEIIQLPIGTLEKRKQWLLEAIKTNLT